MTWDYLQPPFELGSEEELEMLDEIDELLSTHPLVDALAQDDNWKEQQMYMADRGWAKNEDFHFLSRNTLNGSNGISMVCTTSCGMERSLTGKGVLLQQA